MIDINLEFPKQTYRKRNYYLTKIEEKEILKEIKNTIEEAQDKAEEILKQSNEKIISPAPPQEKTGG